MYPNAASRFAWLALAFLPLTAWSKDAAVVCLLLEALLALLAAGRDAWSGLRLTPAGAFGAAFLLWAAAAILWSPAHSPTDWLKAAPLIVAAFLVARILQRAPAALIDGAAASFVLALLALAVLMVAERVTGGGIIGLVRVHDATDRLFDLLSPGLTLLSCLAFPVAPLLSARFGRPWAGLAFIAFCLLLGITYRMDAAPIALACGGISYLIVRVLKQPGFLAVMLGIALVLLSWGAVASAAWRHDEHAWLTAHVNYNWGYRIEIWNRVHQLIGERPWLGHGFDSARIIGQAHAPEANFLHPHNGLLQVWLELGFVGVVLLLATLGATIWRLLKSPLPPAVFATIAAAITVISVFWSVSFGIWQGWWLATIGLTISALVLAARIQVSASSSSDRP